MMDKEEKAAFIAFLATLILARRGTMDPAGGVEDAAAILEAAERWVADHG